MTMTKGVSLIGLLGSLLDGESTADLASAVQGLLDFAKADHEWVVTVKHTHPRRDDPRD
jgi:hypothetical protein